MNGDTGYIYYFLLPVLSLFSSLFSSFLPFFFFFDSPFLLGSSHVRFVPTTFGQDASQTPPFPCSPDWRWVSCASASFILWRLLFYPSGFFGTLILMYLLLVGFHVFATSRIARSVAGTCSYLAIIVRPFIGSLGEAGAGKGCSDLKPSREFLWRSAVGP